MRKEWELRLLEQSGYDVLGAFNTASESKQMALFDLGVSPWHGRTSGKWAYSEAIW
jgi:hypothetical protein